MSGSLNRACLLGNVGRDPEVRSLTNGSKVASFSIATSQSWKDKDGEKKERTEWHNVVVWVEGLIGVIERYVKKGSKIYVEGEIQTRKWEKDGVDRYSTEIVLTGFDARLLLLGDSGGGRAADPNGNAERPSNGYSAGKSGGEERSSRGAPARGGRPDIDDEIPF